MTELKELTELAVTLAYRLKKQTNKFVDAFYQVHYKCQQIREREELNIETTFPIVTAFHLLNDGIS